MQLYSYNIYRLVTDYNGNTNNIDTTIFTVIFYFMIGGIILPSNYSGAFMISILRELLRDYKEKDDFTKDTVIQHFNDYRDPWKCKKRIMDLSLMMGGYYAGNKIRSFSPL